MTTTQETPGAAPYEQGPSPGPVRRRRRPAAAVVATVAAVTLIVGALLVADDDDDVSAPGPTPSLTATVSTAPPTTAAPTTNPPTTNPPPTPPPAIDTSTAVWPYGSSSTRFSDPLDAARSFAVDFVGFVRPVVGPFRQGDSRSGEVDVRPSADGPVTTVFVRQLTGDDSWWGLGAATGNIDITEPVTGAVVSSPLPLHGRSTAFEANVSTEIRQDGSSDALGTGWVMGGANGTFAPFDGVLEFPPPQQPYGALILSTSSMEDGRIWEASVIRVRFADARDG